MEAQRGLGHCTRKPDAVRFCTVVGEIFIFFNIINLLILLGAVLQTVCGAQRTVFRSWFCPVDSGDELRMTILVWYKYSEPSCWLKEKIFSLWVE